jgi:succinate dehydrogenase hydrophobic anchor subunit
MNIPLMILISLAIFMLGVDTERHGKEKTGYHDAWGTLISAIINIILLLWAVGWSFQ